MVFSYVCENASDVALGQSKNQLTKDDVPKKGEVARTGVTLDSV